MQPVSFAAMYVLGYWLCAAWCVSELVISITGRSKAGSKKTDRLSHLLVWLCLCVSLVAALELVPAALGGGGRIGVATRVIGFLGCLLMGAGIAVRWTAVVTLGRQFTIDVSIVKGHQVVERGLYRVIRHPSYLGLLLTLLGLGLALVNWISLIILVALPLAGLLYRISVEEKVLLDHFGAAYSQYMKRTWRLIPGVW